MRVVSSALDFARVGTFLMMGDDDDDSGTREKILSYLMS